MTGSSYIMEDHDSFEANTTSIIFSLKNQGAGALSKALKVFRHCEVDLVHIESRSSERRPGYEFMVECDSKTGQMGKAIEQLKDISSYFNIISRDYKDNAGKIKYIFKGYEDFY